MTAARQHNRILKMHGLGNDFVVFDIRYEAAFPPETALVRAIADRHFGIGCDTVVTVARGGDGCDGLLFFANADGSTAAACGNATRCVARLLMDESGRDRVTLAVWNTSRDRDRAGWPLLVAERAEGDRIRVNMGPPVLDWRQIPLAEEVDIDALPLPGAPSAVAMPNPHCVFFVEDADAVDPGIDGPQFERHPLFPDRTNVEFVSLTGTDHLRMRVYERGGMVTLACGSGACAAAVAAHRRGLTGRRVTVDLDGGTLQIDWRDDGVWMTGPVAHVAEITLHAEFLSANR